MTSKHADLLNKLLQMQQSMVYRMRKDVLAEAERLIVEQERLIERLKLEKEIGRTEMMRIRTGKQVDHSELVTLLAIQGHVSAERGYEFCGTYWYTEEGRVCDASTRSERT